MKILTINAGSSSVKFAVFDMANNQQLFKSEMEQATSIEHAIKHIPAVLENAGVRLFDAVGHRIAHGGVLFHEPQIVNAEVIKAIEDCIPLAPLHNPPALCAIKMASHLWPDIPQIAVFDTAFHQTIPERAFTYAVPEAWRKTGLRRYGFHGTSHKYVMMRVAEELKTSPAQLRIISCHLGNGASVCAIERGVSVDNSMGITSLEGLVMGTRSGDVDPGIFAYLKRTLGLTVEQIEDALYKESGLAALSGLGRDMRDIEKQAAEGNKKAQLAIQVYAYRARKYIGAYAAVMGGVDVIAFTGGIGENCRDTNQIEIAETEAYKLGVDASVRLSGDTKGTPVVTLRGSAGSIQTEGLIVAKRHIHMNSRDAEARGLKHGDQVEVAIQSDGRDLVFRDVSIRVDPHVITEMHIDTDEANAAHIKHGGIGELIPAEGCTAQVTHRQIQADGADKSCCLNKPANKEAA